MDGPGRPDWATLKAVRRVLDVMSLSVIITLILVMSRKSATWSTERPWPVASWWALRPNDLVPTWPVAISNGTESM